MNRNVCPDPGDTLVDEGGSTNCWLDASWSFNDIRYEWDWMFCPYTPMADQLREIWFRLRPTTDEELADEDRLYDLFGDYEMSGIDTSTVYEQVRPGTPHAHRYWTSDR